MAETGNAMRLDRFLWWVRLAKTRQLAQAIVATGTCRIAGRRIERASCPVRVGDTVTFAAHGRVRAVRVVALPLRRGPAPEAKACYVDKLGENVSQEGPGD